MTGDRSVDADDTVLTRLLSRARAVAAERFALVLAGLLLLATLGAGVTYATHISPGERTERATVGTLTETGDFDHSATVERNTSVFEAGSELENRSTYFTRVAPELTVEYGYWHRGADAAAANTTLTLVVSASERSDAPTGDTTDVYWRTTERLDSASSESLAPGERQTARTTLNVTRLRDRIARIESELGASPGDTSVKVVARTRTNATVDGRTLSTDRDDVLTLSLGSGTYGVTTESDGTTETPVTSRRTVTADYGPLRSIGAPLVTVLALVGMVGLVWARRTGRLDGVEGEQRRIEFRREREAFDDWITVGRLPDELADRTIVETESLEGLVDVAIDSDKRVVEDRSTGRFAVLDGDVAYTLEPPGSDLRPVREAAASAAAEPDGPTDTDEDPDAHDDPVFGDLDDLEDPLDADTGGEDSSSVDD